MTTSTSPDPRLDHARYCAEILEQTRLLRRTLDGADLSATVPTCPEWSLRELVVHVGGSHRWAHEIVRTRAAEEVEEETVPGFHGPTAAPDAGGDDGRDAADAKPWTRGSPKAPNCWSRRCARRARTPASGPGQRGLTPDSGRGA